MSEIKCECCGNVLPKSKTVYFNTKKGDREINVCKECYTKIYEIRYGNYTPDQVIKEETTEDLKDYIIERSQQPKLSTIDKKVKFTSSAAKSINILGMVILVFSILAGIGIAIYCLLNEEISGAIGLGVGIATIITGVFWECISSCIAIITENQYQELKNREEK